MTSRYRFVVHACRLDNAEAVQLSEVHFRGGDYDVVREAITAQADSEEGCPADCGPEKAVDGRRDTKWRNEKKRPLHVQLDCTRTVDFFSFTTAFDHEGCDPTKWSLEYSKDGESWAVVCEQQAEDTTPLERSAQTQWFRLQYPTKEGRADAWSITKFLATSRMVEHVAGWICDDPDEHKQLKALRKFDKGAFLTILSNTNFQEGVADLLDQEVQELNEFVSIPELKSVSGEESGDSVDGANLELALAGLNTTLSEGPSPHGFVRSMVSPHNLLNAMFCEHCAAEDSDASLATLKYGIETSFKTEWGFVFCPEGGKDAALQMIESWKGMRTEKRIAELEKTVAELRKDALIEERLLELRRAATRLNRKDCALDTKARMMELISLGTQLLDGLDIKEGEDRAKELEGFMAKLLSGNMEEEESLDLEVEVAQLMNSHFQSGLDEMTSGSWPQEDPAKLDAGKFRKVQKVSAFKRQLRVVNRLLRRVGQPPLTPEELIAVRLYTGPLCSTYDDDEARVTTKLCISSALQKLGELAPSAETAETEGWRDLSWLSTYPLEHQAEGWSGLSWLSIYPFEQPKLEDVPMNLPVSFEVLHAKVESGVLTMKVKPSEKQVAAVTIVAPGLPTKNGLVVEGPGPIRISSFQETRFSGMEGLIASLMTEVRHVEKQIQMNELLLTKAGLIEKRGSTVQQAKGSFQILMGCEPHLFDEDDYFLKAIAEGLQIKSKAVNAGVLDVATLPRFFGLEPWKGFQPVLEPTSVKRLDILIVREAFEALGDEPWTLKVGSWAATWKASKDKTKMEVYVDGGFKHVQVDDLKKCVFMPNLEAETVVTLCNDYDLAKGEKITAGCVGTVKSTYWRTLRIKFQGCEEEVELQLEDFHRISNRDDVLDGFVEREDWLAKNEDTDSSLRLLCRRFIASNVETESCLRRLLHHVIDKLSGKFLTAMREHVGTDAVIKMVSARTINQAFTWSGQQRGQQQFTLQNCYPALCPLECRTCFSARGEELIEFGLQPKRGAGSWTAGEEILFVSEQNGNCFFTKVEGINDGRVTTGGCEFDENTGEGSDMFLGKSKAYALQWAEAD